MANFCGSARTNYFKVRKGKWKALLAFAKGLQLEVVGNAKQVTLLSNDESGWPNYMPDDDAMEGVTIAQQLSPFLADGEVAVMMEVGAEKMCYLHCYIAATDSKGKLLELSMPRDFLELAQRKWPKARLNAPQD